MSTFDLNLLTLENQGRRHQTCASASVIVQLNHTELTGNNASNNRHQDQDERVGFEKIEVSRHTSHNDQTKGLKFCGFGRHNCA